MFLRKEKNTNFLFECFQGLFGIPELKNHTGFNLLQQAAEEKVEKLLEEACSPSRSRKIVTVFDELSDTLCRVADLVSLCQH